MATERTVETADGRLHYEVRGEGPVMLVLGSPMDARPFTPVAEALADDYTVVTADPRGINRSRLNDPEQDSPPDVRADDVAAILSDLGAASADMLGSSGGATTGLAVVARHPGLLRTLVAHEPPLMALLPNAAEHFKAADENVAVFHRDGLGAAWMRFMVNIGVDPGAAPPALGEPSEQDIADGAYFFGHVLQGTVTYEPDIEALTNGRTRVIVGVGATTATEGMITDVTSKALAGRLGIETTEFPGGHGGFMEDPRAFAEVLKAVLATG